MIPVERKKEEVREKRNVKLTYKKGFKRNKLDWVVRTLRFFVKTDQN